MNWQDTKWNKGVVPKPCPKGVFQFQFPGESGHVNYLTCDHDPVKVGQIITIKYRIKTLSGSPVFVSLDPTTGLLPNFRVMIAEQETVNRYWAHDAYSCRITPGLDSMETPLIAVAWQNVNGKPATDDLKTFKQLVQRNMKIVALTFGGGVSFGHGVYVKGGKALFQLLEFSVK